MRTRYRYDTGVRRPLYRRILSFLFNFLAIAGWLIAIIFIASVVFGFFDEILILIWDTFYYDN